MRELGATDAELAVVLRQQLSDCERFVVAMAGTLAQELSAREGS